MTREMAIRSRVFSALPLASYSRAIGWVARRHWPRPLLRGAIAAFVRRFGVDLTESALGIDEFGTFQEFFSRQLRPGARPIDAGARLVSPADGLVVSEAPIDGGSTIQAKGISYDVDALLGEPARFNEGHQVTIYLSPRDYHRVHVPCAAKVIGVRRIAGRRLPVGVAYAESVPRLFAENERVVFTLESAEGVVAVVMVGATGVSAIRPLALPGDHVRAGDELGVFLLGSTVVMLWDARLGRSAAVVARDVVRIGQRII
jgi:phosphatidylserine decarboxylase